MSASPARRAFAGATAAALGLGIGHGVQFPESHWAVITVLTLLRPGPESTPGRLLLRIVATAAGALWVVGLYGMGDPQHRFVIPVSIALIGACYVLIHFTKARYALVLFAVTAGGFALAALDKPLEAPSLVGYRVFHITVGSLLLFICAALFRFHDHGAGWREDTSVPEALDHGLRVMLACCLALLLAALIERPDYAGTMAISVCVLGVRTSFEESFQVGLQRLAGALLGGALCLAYFVFVLDWATSIWSLMIVIFVVSWFCLLLIGVPSVSYLGFQIGFVFAWSIGDAAAPTGDVWTALDRMAQVGLASAALLGVYSLPLRTPGFHSARLRGNP